MTEIPLLQTHAVPQLSPRAPFAPVPYPVPNGRPVADAPQPDEEPVSDTIKCICGYEADDGSSVLCEVCRTWQHVLCYYDDEDQIPRVHECADCQPRALDQARIKERQKAFKNMTYMIERKPKRPAAKSHKKKLKDVNAAVALTNGHADDTLAALDRKSGSPKDHQPPSKRPKTNHKTSGSISSLNQPAAGSRKRAASTAQPVHSPVKSPGPPIPTGYAPDYFSDEFLQLYKHPEYTQIEANSFSDLAVTNSLQTWLWDPEATKQASGGKAREQIFQRHEGTMKSLEEHGPVLKENTGIGAIATAQGPHPTFKWITVESEVPYGGFVGELKGQIGRKEEYCSNPENRWGSLRHPTPFVFFAPFLPLYIDTRHEGTLLRYIRRSCRPNVRMQILITGESEYHFCFIALENIYAGEEISIGWDIDKDVKNALEASLQNGNIHERGIQEVEGVSHWVAGVLSNFGGCACKLPIMECPLALADRRNAPAILASSNAQPLKSKKPRRNGNQNSPLSTGQATNSRAGSEARNRPDHDDENADSRSVSGSSRSKPTSRDITPMTHVSNENAVGLGVEMSDREKRKLMQQEKLFEQLEHDEQHAQRKRKRNSAGSALNTPSVATSKQLGHSESSFPSPAVASKSRAADPNSRSQNMNGRRSNNSSHQRRAGARAPKEAVAPKKLEYKDSSVQTEPDKEFPSLVPCAAARRKPKGSFLRSLLHRTHDVRVHRERSESVQCSPSASHLPDDRMDVDEPASSAAALAAKPHSTTDSATAPPKAASPPLKAEEDVEMQDAIAVAPAEVPKQENEPVSPRTDAPAADQPARPPSQPPQSAVPPEEVSPSSTPASSSAPTMESKATSPGLRVELQPAPTLETPRASATTPPPPSTADAPAPLSLVTENIAVPTPSAPTISLSSPVDMAPPSTVVTPSPVQRKAKMSLSDWTAKRKAKLEAKSHDGDKGDEKDKDKDASTEGDVRDDDDRPPSSSDKKEETSEAKVGEGA
ncbi:hypothetical protein BFW01_g3113 [Lasiodiplodia theobromae]|uniref:Histone-lysine N-methyltransferase 2E n=1 Tax=Lasiodiplodia theobromae TaxID=45133 RepID=A0A5N5DQQ2_9PEZI|nr:Phd finger and set domain protein [Lasiodiplodia theobromae]KAB2580245.1 Histone-lysine N-methyltransferase 2E [Lasiodiplodia theobromae]KAF4541209.1 Phd finger and set domain protein [Lasiodiplodia theobromae]KAF9632251.1 hypothetical protein BFW01_g3113 [Lasiodiplodia theobromae]